MKYLIISILLQLSLLSLAQTNKQKEKDKEKPKELAIITELDRVSYGLGVNIGQNIKRQGIDSVNLEILFKAIEDVFLKVDLKISPEKANQLIIDYIQKLKTETKETKVDLEAKKSEANDFMLRNKSENGIIQLASGVQYKIVKEGTGAKPKATDKVNIQYHGSLIDGTEFESSNGTVVTEKISKLVPGLSEALQLMPVGSKWKIYVPYSQGYTDKGNEKTIGPFETLIFVVELNSILTK